MVVQSRNNSLVAQAKIRAITAEGNKLVNVRVVTMTFDGMMRSMITVPGWQLSLNRRVPFLVINDTKNYKDCYPQFNRNDFPFRSTVIQKDGIWEVVEVAERSLEENEIEECNGVETTAIFFFHQAMEDVNEVGIIHTGADDPFLQPRLREQQDGGDRQREQQGFGWFGRSLEDGVYEVDDADEDMGQQPEAVDDDPFRRRQAVQVGDEEVVEEIDIDGEKYSMKSSLRKLREGLRLCGLPKGRSKAQAWQRLSEHHRHFAETLGAELARREFERRKFAEGGDGVRPQSIPRLPTKAERQIHELTHWPFEDWCMQCVAARGKADPHRRRAEDDLRMEGKAEFPVISMDYCFTRGLTEPTEADKEDLRLYGGDIRGGVSLVVTDDWSRGVLALPVPGKGRSHAKYLAEQIVRYISACGFSTCILKADAEPATRLLLDIVSKARQKLGFKTVVELVGPEDSQANGRVEREIQTVRGLARTLIRSVREGAQAEVDVYGPLAQWAFRHAAWLLPHFRRQNGSPTAYEMNTGRRYVGKLANFGERVLARLPGPNGADRFQVGVWVGKTDRADFHLVFVPDGLRWTRTIRRMPIPYDAETLANVRAWPWSISYGQIGVKQSALLAKAPSTPLPPQMAPAVRAEERAERQDERRQAQQQRGRAEPAPDGGDQRQAGPSSDEAASDPSSSAGDAQSSHSTSMAPRSVADDTVLQDLLDNIREDNFYSGGVDISPKRDGEPVEEEVQSPSKALRSSMTRKTPRLGERGEPAVASSASGSNQPQPDGEPQVRMVVAGELLEDGDADLELPDQPPDLGPDELFEVEAKSIETEIKRLVDMGVLVNAEGADLETAEKLSTRFVMDWRWRDNQWQRRARLVARDYAWINPNRTDTFAPAGGQSLLRLIPCIAQLKGWKLATLDVKDAYLMCPQKKNIRVTVDKEVAEALQIPRDWLLGRVLPGQREGASEWFQHLKGTLQGAGLKQCAEAPTVWSNDTHTIALLIHVDDLIVTGTEEAMSSLLQKLEESYKVSVEMGDQVSFLKRTVTSEGGTTKIQVNDKYLDGIVSLFEGVKLRRTLNEVVLDEKPLETAEEVGKFRSGVGTLLYLAGDRPDIQFHVKELASKLSSPTRGAMATLLNVIGYMLYTKDYHLVMDGNNPSRSFRQKAHGLAAVPEYEENKQCWLLEVAADSDWSGNKSSRSSTSSGCVFVGGNWVYSYSRTQRNITLSSTESEYVALVSGASEGLLLKAVLEHLVGSNVEMKLYADNTSAVAIASKEGVSKIKHLSGKLLWVQQRQGRDFQLRKIDTMTNPSDIGTKVLSGKRVRLLLYLINYNNEDGDLGVKEFLEEKAKKEKREQVRSIRAVIHHEVAEAGEQQTSTLMNKVAKKLMRLTLAALLADVGEALSLADEGGLVMIEPSRPSTSAEAMVYMLVFVIMAMCMLVVVLAYKVYKYKYLAEYHRNMVRQVRAILKQEGERRDRARRRQAQRASREARIARLGVELYEGGESERENFSDDEDIFIRSVKVENYEEAMEEEHPESEEERAMDETVETESLDREMVWGLLDRDKDRPDDEHDGDADVESAGHRLDGQDSIDMEEEACNNTMEEDGESEDSVSTDYGSLHVVNENFEDFEHLDQASYDEYRWEQLFNAHGVEHYVIKQLAWLRGLPVNEAIWNEIRDLMSLQKSIQLGDAGVRKQAINYLMGRRRYLFWSSLGRVDPNEEQEESVLPDEWAAFRYGWGYSTDEQPRDPGAEDSWSSSSNEEVEVEVEVEPEVEPTAPVVTELPDISLGSSTDRPAHAGGKGKIGGKGRIDPEAKDPPVYDEAQA